DVAVRASLDALEWLLGLGVGHIYVKYCSTFDSTSQGNIGPILDAVARRLDARHVAVAPAAPENQRTVYQGVLFVGDQPLAESSMRDHPLTPMRDSSLMRLLDAQSTQPSHLIDHAIVAAGGFALRQAIEQAPVRNLIVDSICEQDLDQIAEAVKNEPMSSGSAGLAGALARQYAAWRRVTLGGAARDRELRTLGGAAGSDQQGSQTAAEARDAGSRDQHQGPALVLAGSCSVATRRQAAHYSLSHPCFVLDPQQLAVDTQHLTQAIDFIKANVERAPMVVSSQSPEVVASVQQRLGRDFAARLVENAFGALARAGAAEGFRRILVAGGETAGAVNTALQVRSVAVGPELAPGVPWLFPVDEGLPHLMLKSGNFGTEDLFTQAVRGE
ncbi:MAG: hypothetical protein LBV00_00570, partial [Propionibacteriaceae bacterium]|nr:hypothetical protein [Propionibacteriaceae bacterium]